MANWCTNKIKASEKVLNLIYDEENKVATFQKLKPMPESLMVTGGGPRDTAIIYALIKMNKFLREETLGKLKNKRFDYYNDIAQYTGKDKESQKKLQELYKYNKEFIPDTDVEALGIKHLRELGNTYISNIINYGYSDWYKWSMNNWGTKWDACDSCGSPKEGYLLFDTANNPPSKIVKELYKKFPDEEIDWTYKIEGMCFSKGFTSDHKGGFIVNKYSEKPKQQEEEEDSL